MKLSSSTYTLLRNVHSPKQLRGFRTDAEIRSFWKKYGPKGFLNIQEISADIVREIRTKLIEKP